jgi:uncharacterized membrane protein HdeD (DUF308 family)
MEMESFTLLVINWKGLVLRGALAVILGLVMVLLPGPTLIAVTVLIGIFVLMLGLIGLAMYLSLKESDKGMVLLLEGILGIAFGIVTIVWPNITALLLILLLGVWCLIEGLVQVYAGLTASSKPALKTVFTVSGVLSIIIGLLFILAPGEGAIALIWLIGVFAMIYGILSISYGLLTVPITGWKGCRDGSEARGPSGSDLSGHHVIVDPETVLTIELDGRLVPSRGPQLHPADPHRPKPRHRFLQQGAACTPSPVILSHGQV